MSTDNNMTGNKMWRAIQKWLCSQATVGTGCLLQILPRLRLTHVHAGWITGHNLQETHIHKFFASGRATVALPASEEEALSNSYQPFSVSVSPMLLCFLNCRIFVWFAVLPLCFLICHCVLHFRATIQIWKWEKHVFYFMWTLTDWQRFNHLKETKGLCIKQENNH